MSEQVGVEVGARGGPVAVKRARDEDARARLRHEGAMLELARHPGVVELVELDDRADVTSLSTVWLGGGTIEAANAPPRRLAALGAQLARTIADLHDRGIVHGRITADHVLLDGVGRVVLAGFSAAQADPVTGASPADDVGGLADVVRSKLPPEHAAALPRLRGSSADRELVDRLKAVAERAADPDPTRRPAARAVASLLAEIAGDEPLPAGPRRLGRPEPELAAHSHPLEPAFDVARELAARLPRPRVLATSVGVIAVVALVVVGTRVATAGGGRAGERTATEDSRDRRESHFAAITTAPTPSPGADSERVWPTAPPCPSVDGAGERVDVDGDGCTEPVVVTSGAILVGDRHYEVAEAGESMVISDWDCDGTATPAVLRPDTGEVFVFDAWALEGATTSARLVGIVPGALTLRSGEGRCGVLNVVDASGRTTRVEVAR